MPSSRVLLQRADGTAKLRALSGRFTPVMVDSDAGVIRTYRLIEAGQDDLGAFYTYSEDERLRLPVTKPSEVQALDGEEVSEGDGARAGALPEADEAPRGGDRDSARDGEV